MASFQSFCQLKSFQLISANLLLNGSAIPLSLITLSKVGSLNGRGCRTMSKDSNELKEIASCVPNLSDLVLTSLPSAPMVIQVKQGFRPCLAQILTTTVLRGVAPFSSLGKYLADVRGMRLWGNQGAQRHPLCHPSGSCAPACCRARAQYFI